jgi:hypothetical protein
MSDQQQEQTIDIHDDPATVEMNIREWNGLLNALNNPNQTPAVVAVGYINRIATQLEAQIPRLIATKQAMESAIKNATCAPKESASE